MPEELCDHCELPLATCVHGMPVIPAAEPVPASGRRAGSAAVKKTPAAKRTPGVVVSRTARRQTPPASYRPHIVAVLRDHGGRCATDVLLEEIYERVQDVLLDRDLENVGAGEVRWQFAARQERAALTREGLMEPSRQTKLWELTAKGMGS